ncbi:hypothetical protein HPB50_018692 [Hyalomma asiaticum]|uniref:Uncharacterized protein n=1 Tax=Hyalomma asiaticum TaxID=266040 RepID=A0ACB7RYA4_HYAAI|nr:hypothetical protein HPB50_018692 [Hyalomma asiaticum]
MAALQLGIVFAIAVLGAGNQHAFKWKELRDGCNTTDIKRFWNTTEPIWTHTTVATDGSGLSCLVDVKINQTGIYTFLTRSHYDYSSGKAEKKTLDLKGIVSMRNTFNLEAMLLYYARYPKKPRWENVESRPKHNKHLQLNSSSSTEDDMMSTSEAAKLRRENLELKKENKQLRHLNIRLQKIVTEKLLLLCNSTEDNRLSHVKESPFKKPDIENLATEAVINQDRTCAATDIIGATIAGTSTRPFRGERWQGFHQQGRLADGH